MDIGLWNAIGKPRTDHKTPCVTVGTGDVRDKFPVSVTNVRTPANVVEPSSLQYPHRYSFPCVGARIDRKKHLGVCGN